MSEAMSEVPSGFVKLRMNLTGTRALLMHNAVLANPLSTEARALREISKKRGKTDEDYADMAKLEFLGSLYLDPTLGPYLPGANLHSAIVAGGKSHKLGTTVNKGVLFEYDVNPLIYSGPRTAEALWNDRDNFSMTVSVKVGTARTMRTRPMFRSWRCEADLMLDTSVLNVDQFRLAARTAGSLVGIGDWRPQYGRFHVTIEEI